MTNTFNTPALHTIGIGMATEQDMGRQGDWENFEYHERDPNCHIRYGVRGGEPFFQTTQVNYDDWVKYAKARRSQYKHASAKERTELIGLEKYGLPHVIVSDLEIRGIPYAEILDSADHTELDRIVANEWPELLWVPKSALRDSRQLIAGESANKIIN